MEQGDSHHANSQVRSEAERVSGQHSQAPTVSGNGRVKSDFHGEVSDARRASMRDQGNITVINSTTKDASGPIVGYDANTRTLVSKTIVIQEGAASRILSPLSALNLDRIFPHQPKRFSR